MSESAAVAKLVACSCPTTSVFVSVVMDVLMCWNNIVGLCVMRSASKAT